MPVAPNGSYFRAGDRLTLVLSEIDALKPVGGSVKLLVNASEGYGDGGPDRAGSNSGNSSNAVHGDGSSSSAGSNNRDSDSGGSNIKILVAHVGEAEYRAYPNQCTHKGKELDFLSEKGMLRCCSGHSTFELSGEVIEGKASEGLQLYAVQPEEEENRLIILLGR